MKQAPVLSIPSPLFLSLSLQIKNSFWKIKEHCLNLTDIIKTNSKYVFSLVSSYRKNFLRELLLSETYAKTSVGGTYMRTRNLIKWGW